MSSSNKKSATLRAPSCVRGGASSSKYGSNKSSVADIHLHGESVIDDNGDGVDMSQLLGLTEQGRGTATGRMQHGGFQTAIDADDND